MYRAHLNCTKLIGHMHIADARMRMMALGTQILNQNIPTDKIEEFVKNAPPELQNPIEEAPFGWNGQSSYLWFDTPEKSVRRQIMRITLKK